MREYRFIGEFDLVTPLRLSSGEEADLADSAVRRGGNGALLVPGTSLAGAFRAYVERLAGASCQLASGLPSRSERDQQACACAVCKLFGDVRPGSDREARASRLVFRDAVVDGGEVRVVDGVAIERGRRSAAERRKFDFEEVAPGARLRVEVRGADLQDRELAWVGSAFWALGSGEIPIGGRVAQGFGRLSKRDLSVRWRDTSTPEHLMAAVLNDAAADAAWPEGIEPFPGRDSAGPGVWSVSLRLAPPADGTFLIADPSEAVATGFDRAPRGGTRSPELPASSFRGALRSAAERILRTLDVNAACDPTDSASCCAARERDAKRRAEPLPERCLACCVFGNEEWGSWLRVDVRRTEVGDHGQPFDHVAIDRFTGGAREGLKFDALAACGGAFEVRLSAPDLPQSERAWVTGLVALAIQDLHHGRWQVGHGSARGHGLFMLTEAPIFAEPLDAAVRALWAKVGVAYPEVA